MKILYKSDLPESKVSDKIIQKEWIGTYFSAVKEKYNMITPTDIKGYTQTMFGQI